MSEAARGMSGGILGGGRAWGGFGSVDLMGIMSETPADFQQAPCPHLPPVETALTAATLRDYRAERGEGFYLAALRYSQSLWRQGKPAQAILQLNQAWSADLGGGEGILRSWPAPYEALVWLLTRSGEGMFLGNPVRHFQHLATRMHEVRREPRVWRAWACFHLAEAVLETSEHPRDLRQIEQEGVVIPAVAEVVEGLRTWGWDGEDRIFGKLMGG